MPNNGHKLIVGIVARISGCASQKELSIEDQVDHGKEEVVELYDGPVEYRVAANTPLFRLSEPALRDLFAREKTVNVGVILGSVSGNLAWRDFDTMESYDAWAEAHPELAEMLPTVETSRGRHVYFRAAVKTAKFDDGGLRGDQLVDYSVRGRRQLTEFVVRLIIHFLGIIPVCCRSQCCIRSGNRPGDCHGYHPGHHQDHYRGHADDHDE